jgi:glucokinase
MADATIGVDMGGTHLRVAVVDAGGTICHDHLQASPSASIADVVAAVGTVTTDLVKRASDDGLTVNAIGVGVAALVDNDGVARYAPNVPGLVNAPLRADIADATGLQAVVDNDANVAAWGELAHGAAQGARHALIFTLGTGIGGGIILDGSVYRGAHGFAAEVGHWQFDPHGPQCACGEVGHWEAFGSGTALGRLARQTVEDGGAPSVLARAGGDVAAVTGEHVGAAAQDGMPDALAILDRFADYVAIGFANLSNIFDPEVIVVSGGLVNLGDLLLDRIRARFPRHLEGRAFRPAVPIVPAQLGDRAGVIGAAVLARYVTARSDHRG